MNLMTIKFKLLIRIVFLKTKIYHNMMNFKVFIKYYRKIILVLKIKIMIFYYYAQP